MPAPIPLPDDLRGRPLTSQDLRSQGLSQRILRGQRFIHHSRDLYLPFGWAGALADECTALVPLLPDSHAFCDVTAAMLWEAPVPLRTQGQLHVVTTPSQEPPRRSGVVSHQRELPTAHVCLHNGLKVTTPARTLLDLAPTLRLHELVAVGDFCLRVLHLQPEALDEMVTWASGRRGIRRLREASSLLHPGSESPQESVLRVWLVLGGLPRLEPNVEVWDDDGLVARVDLLSRQYRLAVEYEGAYHRSREQYAADILRRARLAAAGFEVVQVEATMMRSPIVVVQHVSDAFRRRGWEGTPVRDRLIR